ncbi:acyltransferase [Peribacillus sp. FSL E2-0159]|uniref:acyltransferase n=1 Tax=Peribacillus sp. FSL E2-0159 TaxID=2975289 RepID=UPI003159B4FC
MLIKIYLVLLKKINRKKYAQKVYKLREKQLKTLGVKIGEDCRIENAKFGSEPYLITIGNHVTVGANVQFVTHDGGVWILREKYPDIDVFGPIEIGDNCFIGINSIIMPNVKIGENSVVAAGSIVTKNIEANSIVAGVPARLIRKTADYEEKVLRNAFHTKKLNYGEKKSFLVKHFYQNYKKEQGDFYKKYEN